jgi:hypothetical protein
VKQQHLGRFHDTIRFIFNDDESGEKFIITRKLTVIIGNKSDHELLKPTVPFQPLKRTGRTRHAPVKEFVDGIKPPSLVSISYRSRLPYADIPMPLVADLNDDTLQTQDLIRRVRENHLPMSFEKSTYGAYFKTLLWVEEKRQE